MAHEEYVAADGGWIRPEILSDPALYEMEKERVFGRSWLLLGHVSQLPEPGSFLRTFMGEESVIVTRDRSGAIGAFLNACRHRGFQVCQEDRGTAHRFQCRYHGWVYGSDGTLIGVPGEESIYYKEIDKRRWGLAPVAQVDIYKGLIFGNFDPDAPSLTEFLGDMAWYLDVMLDRREGGTELLGPHRWRIAANWKVIAENHCGDEYHIGFAHGSVFPPDLGPMRATPIPGAREIRPGLGHGLGVNIYPDEMKPEEWLNSGINSAPPHVVDYYVATHDEMVQRLGRQRAHMTLIHGAVWPNFGMVPIVNSLRIIQPRGPHEVEMWSYCLVDRDAPPGVKAWLVAQSAASFGPAGAFEQDDAGNWAAVTKTSAGNMARKIPLNLQMGLGHEERSDRFPGELGLTASEINQRGFYLRWAQDMFGSNAA
ncbi:MAG: Rieske 2Fe-2S domain-containing protein [Parvibaculum sp.]|nr:Rieske 2Fe-2S domain-containing protein [Parvibaculum sp.]